MPCFDDQAVATTPDRLANELAGRRLCLLLDYDGTLVPFAPTPEQAVPDEALLALLARLALRHEVHIASGRTRASLEHFLGHLPLGLHADHGYWSRFTPGSEWIHSDCALDWLPLVATILNESRARTPGCVIEEKSATLSWHYRLVEPGLAAQRLAELRKRLTELASEHALTLLDGACVLEVRPHAIHKGLIAERVRQQAPAEATFVAMGDDWADEDLFTALPPQACTIRVGTVPSRARWRLTGVNEARRLLEDLTP